MNRLQNVGEKLVIVIDPGHGGENLGTIENGYEEKSMNMITARAMYEELCLYDNVEVYLTRTEDVDLSLKERAEFAKSVNADFMFSLHYNASVNHDLFGAEVWVQMNAPANAYGFQFGKIWLENLGDRGLFVRGVKTRVGQKGDYYGILREAATLDVPTVILEHCHVDEQRDEIYCDSEEKLMLFGREDATAVAKYFGLKSSELNVDYSDYLLADVSDKVPVSLTVEDTSEPDICTIEFQNADYEQGVLSFTVTAADYDSPLMNYTYSIDGGASFSERAVWPGVNTLTGEYTDTFTLNLNIPEGVCPSVVFRAYNMFGLYTDSNLYTSPRVFSSSTGKQDALESYPAEIGLPEDTPESFTEAVTLIPAEAVQSGEKGNVSFLSFLGICLGIVVLLFLILLISQCMAKKKKK
ncbi:MAG: N-acetylmuramoyl-L-alanine amidase [Acetatifactor sp.]